MQGDWLDALGCCEEALVDQRCSRRNRERRGQKAKRPTAWVSLFVRISGAQGRNRTADTGIFNPLLYRLSYLGNGALLDGFGFCLSSAGLKIFS